jgi:hypothetical protein
MRFSRLLVVIAVAAIVGAFACDRHEPAPGVIMLAVQTDLVAGPHKDLQAVGIYIRDLDNARTIYQRTEPVFPDGSVKFPATLAIVGRNHPGVAVRIRVVGFANSRVRVMRDAVLTIPRDRVALLALPLRWINDGMATGTEPDAQSFTGAVRAADELPSEQDPFGTFAYTDCKGENTVIDGACVGWDVDSSKLPDYVESDLYPGGNAGGGGVCFDVEGCFSAPETAILTLAADCTLSRPEGAFTLGVHTPVTNEGACFGTGCIIPLDPNPVEGWTEDGANVKLSPGICARVQRENLSVVATTHCGKKLAYQPICGEASTAGGGTDLPTDLDASVDGSDGGPGAVRVIATAVDTPGDIAADSDPNGFVYVGEWGVAERIPKSGPKGDKGYNVAVDVQPGFFDRMHVALTTSPSTGQPLLGVVDVDFGSTGNSTLRVYDPANNLAPITSTIIAGNGTPEETRFLAGGSAAFAFAGTSTYWTCKLPCPNGAQLQASFADSTEIFTGLSFLAGGTTAYLSLYVPGNGDAGTGTTKIKRITFQSVFVGNPTDVVAAVDRRALTAPAVGVTNNLVYWGDTSLLSKTPDSVSAHDRDNVGLPFVPALATNENLQVPNTDPFPAHAMITSIAGGTGSEWLFWTTEDGTIRAKNLKTQSAPVTVVTNQVGIRALAADADTLFWTVRPLRGDGGDRQRLGEVRAISRVATGVR